MEPKYNDLGETLNLSLDTCVLNKPLGGLWVPGGMWALELDLRCFLRPLNYK